jgi:UDP-N-acetyl-D-glucosamine dehydrogenase
MQHIQIKNSKELQEGKFLDQTTLYRTNPQSVAVVGLGYVGLPLSLLAREKGFSVVGIDLDPRKRATITSGQVPDLDIRFLAALRKKPLRVSGKFSAVKNSRVVVICVPTPVDHSHLPDLSLVASAARSVAEYLRPGHLVILESTVHPGTSEEIVVPILEDVSGLSAGIDFDFAHCPERINPGDAEWGVENIPRVVGGITPRSREEAAKFYRTLLSSHVEEMGTIREAEAVKMVENSFRDINIAFVNELAMSFNKLGIDVTNVLRGASTKPFGFMLFNPGCGVGGHCIPVDPYYLIEEAKKNGFSHRFLSLAREINNGMPAFTVELLEKVLKEKSKSLFGAKVALLGLSYKANVSDLRESPAFEIAKELEQKGALVRTFDPYSIDESSAKTLEEALQGADGVVIATAHNEFKRLSPALFQSYGVGIIVDGRNCLNKELFQKSGIIYRGIGR